MSAAQEEI